MAETDTATQTPNHTPPPAAIHLARCVECDFSVRYSPSSNGHGFVLLDSDRALGIGDAGRPICPNGHGEMEIADDRLPIEQAIGQVAEQLDVQTQRLPFPSPPFNYEGALHEIFEKQKAVAILEGKFNDADERRKKAKGALDDGHAELSALIENLQRREQDRLDEIARRDTAAAAGHPEDTNLVRCAWEEQHPGETCPICGDPDLHPEAARDSAAHLEEVAELAELRDITSIVDALGEAEILIHDAKVRSWTPEDRAAVRAWAVAVAGDGNDPIPERPAVLGKHHVAGPVVDNQDQCCTQCDELLISGGEGANYFATGLLVGTDCRGKAPARQISKRGKTKATK